MTLHTEVMTSAVVKLAGDDESASDVVVHGMVLERLHVTLSSLSRPADSEGWFTCRRCRQTTFKALSAMASSPEN